jgi:hypothetical protein
MFANCDTQLSQNPIVPNETHLLTTENLILFVIQTKCGSHNDKKLTVVFT